MARGRSSRARSALSPAASSPSVAFSLPSSLFLLPFLVLLAYWPSIQGGILWDDPGHITRPDLRSFDGLRRIWFEIGATQQYYPVLHSAFWLEHRLWGDATVGYRLVNIALHSGSAILLVLILRTLAIPGALLAGVVFALHPVAVESVAWISEQKNTLSAFLYFASAYAYLKWDHTRDTTVQKPAASSQQTYWIATLLFLAALLAKSVTATLPAALLLVIWWQRGRLDWRRDVRPLAPWFAAAVAAGLLTIWFERELIGAEGSEFDLSPAQRILLAGRVIWFYLWTLFWPHNLTFIYPRWTIDPSAAWQWLFPAGVFLAALALGVMARCYRGPLAGYLYFCGTLVPVLGFVNVYPFRYSYVADHFQYLAMPGVIVPLVAIAVRTTGGRLRLLGAFALVTVLVGLTWQRSTVYVSAESLYRDTVARNPAAWMAYENLGTELAAQERFEEAIAAFEGTLRARPSHAQGRRNLALAHLKLGTQLSRDSASVDRALLHLREAARINPELAEAHYRIANLVAGRDPTAAIRGYQEALRLDSGFVEARLNLGSLLTEMPDRHSDAIQQFEQVLRLKPDYFQAHYNLGTLLMDVPARRDAAIRHLEEAIRLSPESVEARINLGVLLADVPGRSDEALRHLDFALARRPDLMPVAQLAARLRSNQR